MNQDLSAALDAYTELERGGRVGGGGGGGEVACKERWVGFSARQMHLLAGEAGEGVAYGNGPDALVRLRQGHHARLAQHGVDSGIAKA